MAPYRTAQKLADSLEPGQKGCFRTGVYSADNQIKVTQPGITLSGFPGEEATIVGRLWIAQGADGVTVSSLGLDGRNRSGLPSPTVNANDTVFSGDDVTNHHTEICFALGHAGYGRPERTVIESSRIHDCGKLPSRNQDHGIYVATADDTVIRDNYIYDNADRGIQLYPDAQRTTITGNVIDGNGEGIIFSGLGPASSDGNVVERNLITNSTIRYDVESYYPPGSFAGVGNLVRDNCLWNGARGEIQQPQVGFEAVDNKIVDPLYVNRALGDYRLQPGSPCAAL